MPNNALKYVSPNFRGLSAEAMYSFSNRANGFADNRAYSFGASYAQGPFTIAGGGIVATNPNGATSLGDGSACGARARLSGRPRSAWSGAIRRSTTWRPCCRSGWAAICRSDSTLQLDNYEASVKYALTSAWSVSAAYAFTDGAYGDRVSVMEHGDAANRLRPFQAHRPCI
ncbi:Outer membrane protein (porin) [Candidatus Burkholderia brachyanthoides]|nr:Outer membrane protein (porin) [Candidatus Burkholderia brachyanthoides]